MARYGADYLRRLHAAVDEFDIAFEKWAATQEESEIGSTRSLFPTARTKDGQDPSRVRTLELDVAEAAGAASRAVAVTGAQITVAGYGPLDPIANWALMSAPKALFSPQDVRNTAATVRGRLRLMIDEAEAATETDLPAFSPAQLHPVIWTAAAAHWTSHQYRAAVREAAEALNAHWKGRLARNDIDDTPFWQQTLAPGEPSLGRPPSGCSGAAFLCAPRPSRCSRRPGAWRSPHEVGPRAEGEGIISCSTAYPICVVFVSVRVSKGWVTSVQVVSGSGAAVVRR
ncbi:TIGR02391 family protein [Kitasatospora sp. NBC_01560]|uniref:TIGR02391 family protein n=1 Tax=Kitasatospora sp. NBC_01560 TaxID=2975965 RepID=UPI00386C3EB0